MRLHRHQITKTLWQRRHQQWLVCLQDRKLELLELWKVALSPDAANQLDLRQYVTNSMVMPMGLAVPW